MNNTRDLFGDLWPLLDSANDEPAAAEDSSRLGALLVENSAARRAFLGHFQLQADIRLLTRAHEAHTRAIGRLNAMRPENARPAASGRSAAQPQRTAYFHQMRVVSIAIATAAVIVLLSVMAYLREPRLWRGGMAGNNGPSVPANDERLAAHLTQAIGCVWEGETAWKRGAALGRGDVLFLRKGIAEVSFLGDATVVVEGPASFTIEGASVGQLANGRLLTKVGKLGAGFRVATPLGDVVDLGTEFGVCVDEELGCVDVEVFSGSVQFDCEPVGDERLEPGGSPLILNENDGAVRISPREGDSATEARPIPPNAALAELRDRLRAAHLERALLVYEPFRIGDDPANAEYKVGPLAGQNPAGRGVRGPWSVRGVVEVRNDPLPYADHLYSRGGGGSVVLASFDGQARRQLRSPVTDATTGTLYIGYFMRLASTDDQRYRGFGLWQGDARVLAVGTSTKHIEWPGRIGIAVNDQSPNREARNDTLGDLDTEVNLCVLKFELSKSPRGDRLTAWRNPPLNQGPDPPGGVTLRDFDIEFEQFGFQRYRQGTTEPDEVHALTFGDVRMGSSWQAVVEGEGAE